MGEGVEEGVDERGVGERDVVEVDDDGPVGGGEGFGQDMDGVEVEFPPNLNQSVAGPLLAFGLGLGCLDEISATGAISRFGGSGVRDSRLWVCWCWSGAV